MNQLRQKLQGKDALVRVLPFVVFVGLTALQGELGEASKYWLYFAKTIVGAIAVWMVWPLVAEAGVRFSNQALVAGVGVFGIWVGFDRYYPDLIELNQNYLCPVWKRIGMERLCNNDSPVWNPFLTESRPLAIFFVIVRLVGSSLVVPPIEEFFYRSFLYRWIDKANFMQVPLKAFILKPFVITCVIFGFVHHQWLAGIICGAIYQFLVIKTGRLGDAIVAHGITNFLLGLYIIYTGDYHFW